MIALREVGIWPVRAHSISHTKGQLASMARVIHEPCTNQYCRRGWSHNLTEIVVSKVQSVYDDVQGVCLDCVKLKHLGVTGECRVTHEGLKKDGTDSWVVVYTRVLQGDSN